MRLKPLCNYGYDSQYKWPYWDLVKQRRFNILNMRLDEQQFIPIVALQVQILFLLPPPIF